MILTTKRLLLRPLGVADLKTVHQYSSDRENTKYMMFLPRETETETKQFLLSAEAEWKKENPKFFEFAIVLNKAQIVCPSAKEDVEPACCTTSKAQIQLQNMQIETDSSEENTAQSVCGRTANEQVPLQNTPIGAVSLYLDEAHLQGELGWIISKKYQNNGYATEAAKAVVAFAQNNLKLQKLVAQCDFRNAASAKVMQKLGMTLLSDNGTRTYAKRNETAREFTYILNLN